MRDSVEVETPRFWPYRQAVSKKAVQARFRTGKPYRQAILSVQAREVSGGGIGLAESSVSADGNGGLTRRARGGGIRRTSIGGAVVAGVLRASCWLASAAMA